MPRKRLAELFAPSRPTARAVPSVDALAEKLVRELDARTLPAAKDGERILAIDCGEGRNVRVALGAHGAQLSAMIRGERVYDEEHGAWENDETVNDPVLEMAGSVAERLQDATGWHVESEKLLGFDPAGRCAGCGAELFEWQDVCGACGAEVPDTGADPLDGAHEDDDPLALAEIVSVLRPSDDTITPWQQPAREVPIPTLLGALEGPGVRVAQSGPSAAVAFVKAGAQTLHVSVRRDVVHIGVAVKHDREQPSDAARERARAIVEALLPLTGWSVDPVVGPEHEPCGRCARCGAVLYRFERACRCGEGAPAMRTRSEEMARAYLDVLLAGELIELEASDEEVEPAKERLEACLAASFREHGWDRLVAALLQRDEVADVFGSETQLDLARQRAERLALERMRARA